MARGTVKAKRRWWRRRDGEGGVGGGEDGRGRWRRRRWRRGWSMDGGGRDGAGTVEPGEKASTRRGRWMRGRWRRGRWTQDDLDEREVSKEEERSRWRGKKTGTRGTRGRPLFFFNPQSTSRDLQSRLPLWGNHYESTPRPVDVEVDLGRSRADPNDSHLTIEEEVDRGIARAKGITDQMFQHLLPAALTRPSIVLTEPMNGASPSQIRDALSPPADSTFRVRLGSPRSFKPFDEKVEIHDQAPPKNQEDELPIVRLHIKVSSKDKKKERDNPAGKNERSSLLRTLASTPRFGLPMTERQMSGRRRQGRDCFGSLGHISARPLLRFQLALTETNTKTDLFKDLGWSRQRPLKMSREGDGHGVSKGIFGIYGNESGLMMTFRRSKNTGVSESSLYLKRTDVAKATQKLGDIYGPAANSESASESSGKNNFINNPNFLFSFGGFFSPTKGLPQPSLLNKSFYFELFMDKYVGGLSGNSGRLKGIDEYEEESTATKTTMPVAMVCAPSETPTESMGFIARLWSLSAQELSKALNHTDTSNEAVEITTQSTSQLLIPPSQPCQPQPHVCNLQNPTLEDEATKAFTDEQEVFLLHQALKEPASNKKMGIERREESRRTELTRPNYMLPYQWLAIAAIAATTASSAAQCSEPYKTSGTVASAAALVASHCVEIAEEMGAERDQVLTFVNSAINVKTNGDIMTNSRSSNSSLPTTSTRRSPAAIAKSFLDDLLSPIRPGHTASLPATQIFEILYLQGHPQHQSKAFNLVNCKTINKHMLTGLSNTALRGAATLKARLEKGFCKAALPLNSDLIQDKEMGTSALTFVTRGGELLMLTRKGALHWKQVTISINSQFQLYAGGGQTEKQAYGVVADVHCDILPWMQRESEEESKRKAYFGIKTADRFLSCPVLFPDEAFLREQSAKFHFTKPFGIMQGFNDGKVKPGIMSRITPAP
ncbi:hypothetical protein Syun_012081 [Stephania yunnanensis]|uniref:Uncharacterized protein n=1 Tax=Stephania yunnanensis TaxID=152371 RepID=A0AAP0JYY6_9MAGN